MRQGGGGEVVICFGYPGIPCYWSKGGIVVTLRLSRSLWGKPSGADPEHRSEKKLAVQREGRRYTKGAWAL